MFQKIANKEQEIIKLQKDMQQTKEVIEEKNEEVTKLKRKIQQTKEEMIEEIENKNQKITQLRNEIKDIKDTKDTNKHNQEITEEKFIKILKNTINDAFYEQSIKNKIEYNKKNLLNH